MRPQYRRYEYNEFEKCRAICRDGIKCKNNAIVRGLCIRHLEMELKKNGIKK